MNIHRHRLILLSSSHVACITVHISSRRRRIATARQVIWQTAASPRFCSRSDLLYKRLVTPRGGNALVRHGRWASEWCAIHSSAEIRSHNVPLKGDFPMRHLDPT